MNGFITLLEPIIKNTREEDDCVQGIEFWESISTEYVYRVNEGLNPNNYVTGENGAKVVSWLL